MKEYIIKNPNKEKLLEKKKTENAKKFSKEIADFISQSKKYYLFENLK